MAPPKVLGQNRQTSTAALRTGVTTRRQNAVLNNLLKQPNVRDTRSKRKAEASPPKEKTAKRSAFANITNVCSINKFIFLNTYFQKLQCKFQLIK